MAFAPLSGSAGIQPGFLASLERLRQLLPNNLGSQIGIRSGYRSPEHQRDLFNRAVRKYGSVAAARKWVAPPGRSQHNRGNAVDLSYGSPEAMRAAHQYAAQAGLTFPMSYENWHIEPIGARGGGKARSVGQAVALPPGTTALSADTATPAPATPESTVADILSSATVGGGGESGGGGGLPSLSGGGGGGSGGLLIGHDSPPPDTSLETQPVSATPEQLAAAPQPGFAASNLASLADLFTLPTIGQPGGEPEALPGFVPGQAKALGRKVWK